MQTATSYANLDFDQLLRQLAGYAGSELTRDLISSIEVVFHPARIEENLDQTAEALRFITDKPTVELPAYSQMENLAGLWERIGAGDLVDANEARQMIRFLDLTQTFDALQRHITLGEFPRLADVAAAWQPQDHLHSLTRRVFNEEGEVRDSASKELGRIRAKLRQFEAQVSSHIGDILHSVRDHTGEDALLTIRGNRFVVLMPRSLAGQHQGNIVDVSGSGQSIYFEPASVGPMNAERQHLFLAEDQEVRNILRDYSIQVAGSLSALQADMAILVKYDYIFARARYANALTATRPQLSPDGGFEIYRAVHPLLFKQFIPEDLIFSGEKCLVVSGVNAGGKTVLLKILGLYSLMAALGCFVPGQARLPYISGLYADIGDDQSALTNLSTFTAHLRFITELWGELEQRDNSEAPVLVLIDEIGTGTEPGEGAAFAYGLITALLEYPVLLALTTHYDILKTLAFERSDVKNVCLEFDQELMQPTYRILDNQPGQSYAFAIARRWGIPEAALTAGMQMLGQEERKMAAILGELEEINREARETRNELRTKAQELEQAERRREQLAAELKAEKQRFSKQAESYKQQLEHRIDALLAETKQKLKTKARQSARKHDEFVKAASKSAGVVRRQKEEVEEVVADVLAALAIHADEIIDPAAPIAVGDLAAVANSSVKGLVQELDAAKGEAVISYMGKRINVKLAQLAKVQAAKPQAFNPLEAYNRKHLTPTDVEKDYHSDLHNSADTLDLHGQFVEEARESLEVFISAALLSGVNTIRIMHGVGTGKLRTFVQDYLRRNRHVRNVRHADVQDGGVGVTLAELI